MTTLTIHVTHASGRNETFTLEGKRLRIGTAAFCEVRLPLGEAAPEHVALEDRGLSGLHLEALAFSPPPTLDGVPFTKVLFAPSSVLEIGGTHIRVATHALGSTAAGKDEKEKTSPLAYVAGAVILPLLAWQYAPKPEDEVPSAPEAPALFGAASAGCAQREPDTARALAGEQLALADAKRERQPFFAHDGVLAVGLYRSARACFDVAQAAELSRRAADAEVRLTRELEEGYRTRRARLEHALGVKSYRVARSEVRALLELLKGRGGEYVDWLSNLERRLKLLEGTKE